MYPGTTLNFFVKECPFKCKLPNCASWSLAQCYDVTKTPCFPKIYLEKNYYFRQNLTSSDVNSLLKNYITKRGLNKLSIDVYCLIVRSKKNASTLAQHWTTPGLMMSCKMDCEVHPYSADRKTKMAALASDLLRHFQLLLWNAEP